MLTKSINFKNFKVNKVNKVNKKIDKDFKILIKEKSTLLQSLGTTYKNIYTKKNSPLSPKRGINIFSVLTIILTL